MLFSNYLVKPRSLIFSDFRRWCPGEDVASGAPGDDQQLHHLDGRGTVMAGGPLHLHHSQVPEQPRPGPAGPLHTPDTLLIASQSPQLNLTISSHFVLMEAN